MAEVQIVVVEGPNEGREFELSGATTVGRDPSAGIVIDDPEASRRHASLSVEGSTVTVEDLGSTNGTFVNGQRLSASHTLAEGEKLRIGTTVFELRLSVAEATRVGTALPDLDDIAVTAPRNVPDFAKEEPPAPAEPEPPAAPPAEPSPPATTAPPPAAGPPGGAGGIPGGPPPTTAPPPATPPPAAPPPAAGPPPPAAPPPPGPPPPPAGPPPGAPPPSAPPPGFAPPPQVPVGGPPVAYGGGAPLQGSYPTELEIDGPPAEIAWWRPLLQGLMALPHYIALAFVGIAAYLAFVVVWFTILFTGRYPAGMFNFLVGVMRWAYRVTGYTYLMTEQYPPFSLEDAPYPIRFRAQYPENGIARWRPLLQGLMAIPHIIVIYFLGIAAYIAFIIAWFSILFTRRYPPGVFNFIAGVMRWQARVAGYILLMTEEYPPFELG